MNRPYVFVGAALAAAPNAGGGEPRPYASVAEGRP
jgi:hypothetical protein